MTTNTNSELKQVTFLTTRTSTGSKVDVLYQSQPLTQSSDVTHAVRVCQKRHLLKGALQSVCKQNLCLHFCVQNIELYSTTIYIFKLLEYNK
jgi:hypothetical protein